MSLVKFVFQLYQRVVSPALAVAFNVHCRYEETCSRYAERMMREQGFLKGLGSAMKRIASCR